MKKNRGKEVVLDSLNLRPPGAVYGGGNTTSQLDSSWQGGEGTVLLACLRGVGLSIAGGKEMKLLMVIAPAERR